MCLLTSEIMVPTGSSSTFTGQAAKLQQAHGQDFDTTDTEMDDLERTVSQIPMELSDSDGSDSGIEIYDPDDPTLEKYDVHIKRCFVCLEEIEDSDDAHRTLTPDCGGHFWMENGFICTGCLRKYMKQKMFPLGDGEGKRNFPSQTVRCYQCNLPVPHAYIKKYAEPETFSNYDRALCRRYLEQDESILKCAFEDCDGAEWTEDPECANSKVFRCPVCVRDTCLECNGPLQNHLDRPCPTGKDARNPLRIKLQETRSKFKLKRKNKCPKCPIRYEKISGCDHIVCGSKYSGSDFSGGCDYHFCHRCKGEWTRHGHKFYCLWFYWRR